jgi:DNA-directed RNA polymerase specialized sigma24 family protein
VSASSLLRRCAAGNEPQHWRQFVRRHEDALRAGVLRGFQVAGVARPQWADREDMLQEVYCRLLQHGRRRLRHCPAVGETAVSAFLYRLAVRVVLDQTRKRLAQRRGGGLSIRPEHWSGEFDRHPCPQSESGEMRLVQRDLLATTLRRHGGSRRRDVQMWLLAAVGGFEHREVARCFPGKVTPRMVSRGVERVRGHLRRVGGELAALL